MKDTLLIKKIQKLSHQEKIELFKWVRANLIQEVNETYETSIRTIQGGYYYNKVRPKKK